MKRVTYIALILLVLSGCTEDGKPDVQTEFTLGQVLAVGAGLIVGLYLGRAIVYGTEPPLEE